MHFFGETIRSLRISQNLSLKSVADSIEIDISLLSKIERGRRTPSMDFVKKLAKFYKIDPGELARDIISDHIALRIYKESDIEKILQRVQDKIGYLQKKHNIK